MREVDLFSLINQMVDHGAVLPSHSHTVGLVHCLYLTIPITSIHTVLHTHSRCTGLCTAYRAPNAQKFQVMGDVANLPKARFAPQTPTGDDFLSYRSALVTRPVSRLVSWSSHTEPAAMGYTLVSSPSQGF
jgi:hypothetical protein